MEYQAQLRVFQPLSAFSDAMQPQLIRAQNTPRQDVEFLSAQRAEQRVYREPANPFPPASQEELVRVIHRDVTSAHDEVVGHSEFFCPEELALRSELSVQHLEEDLGYETSDLLVDHHQREKNMLRLYESDLLVTPADNKLGFLVHTIISSWNVPMSWFTLFSPENASDDVETLHTGPHPYTGHFCARRTVPLVLALERVHRAAAALALHPLSESLLSDIAQLVTWLEEFHPDSVVELDYGGLARFVWPDESAYDVHTMLEALADHDTDSVLIAQQRFSHRWFEVQEYGQAN